MVTALWKLKFASAVRISLQSNLTIDVTPPEQLPLTGPKHDQRKRLDALLRISLTLTPSMNISGDSSMSDDANLPAPQGQFLIYTDGASQLQVRLDGNTVWLTQKLIAELYEVSVKTVNEHLVNIYGDAEVPPEATIRKFRIVQSEGSLRGEGRRVKGDDDKFTGQNFRVCKTDCEVVSGPRSRQWCRSNARPTVDSFGNLDWSKCRRRTSQPKSCGLLFEVFDRLQGSTRNPLLAPPSRRNGDREERTTCSVEQRMQRADRHSYNHCQENTRKQTRQMTSFHPSLFQRHSSFNAVNELKKIEKQGKKESKRKPKGGDDAK